MCVCGGGGIFVRTCVCVPNIFTVIVTPENVDLMGTLFLVPMRKLINHTALCVLEI